jgi:hypothetical protein
VVNRKIAGLLSMPVAGNLISKRDVSGKPKKLFCRGRTGLLLGTACGGYFDKELSYAIQTCMECGCKRLFGRG